MLETVDKLEGRENARACYVARSANLEKDAFESTVEILNNMGKKTIKPPDVDIEEIKKQAPMDLAQQKDAMSAMFSQDRRVHRKIMRYN
jgi:hypothetical protein